MKRERGTLGFTLLELLIVVIIIGILAAVALPQFSRMTRRSRGAEALAVVDGIATGELASYQENQTFTTVALTMLTIGPNLRVDVPLAANTNWTYAVQAGTTANVVITAGGAAATPVAGMLVTCTVRADGSRATSNNF